MSAVTGWPERQLVPHLHNQYDNLIFLTQTGFHCKAVCWCVWRACVCVCTLSAQSAPGQPQSWPSLALIRLGAIIPALPYKCTGGIKWPQRPACHRHWSLVCRLSRSRETRSVHCYSYHLHAVLYCALFLYVHFSFSFFLPSLFTSVVSNWRNRWSGLSLSFFPTLSVYPSENKTASPQALCSLA